MSPIQGLSCSYVFSVGLRPTLKIAPPAGLNNWAAVKGRNNNSV